MNEHNLWKQRFNYFQKEVGRYGKYIFNNHIVIILLILVGGGGFYYQQWLTTVSNDFPVAFVISLVLTFILTSSAILTFVREADIVFLLPLEERLKKYFLKSFFFSYFIQIYIVLIGYGVLLPLYQHGFDSAGVTIVLIGLLLLLIKLWNMAIVWECTYAVDSTVRIQDRVIRLVVNFLFVYTVLNSLYLYTAIIVVVMIGYLYFQHNRSKGKNINWEYLINSEQRRWALFYRIANMFVDVPHIKAQAKRRKWLDFFLSHISYSQENTYKYLYTRTFLRSGDYLGLYARLLVIGSIVIFMLPNDYAAGVAGIVFLYLIAFQLQTLHNHHNYTLWTSLYPVDEEQKAASFSSLFRSLLYIGSGIFGVVVFIATMNVLVTVGTLVIGYLFSYLFVNKKSGSGSTSLGQK